MMTKLEQEYWSAVAACIAEAYRVPVAQAKVAMGKYRKHLKSAGETIYNDDPASVAEVIVQQGLLPGVSTPGVVLDLYFILTDKAQVVKPASMAKSAHALIGAISRYEQKLGGKGLKVVDTRAEPGQVVITLEPCDFHDAAKRLHKVAKDVARLIDEEDEQELNNVEGVSGVVRLAA